MEPKQPFFLTTAIAYANAAPHIGFALELLYADAMARFQRLMGRDVRFSTGTDEHGQKIAQKAAEAGREPQPFTDGISAQFRALADRLGVSYTDFIRTTEDRHARAAAAFWNLVNERGYIYKKRYAGLYCVGCEQFKTEKELVDGLCPDHKTKPELLEEENYFFKLSAFADRLRDLYRSRDFVIPQEKFNEAIQLVEGGLEDMSISRSRKHLSWGIPVPGDPDQVIYVWFDALVNYLTVTGFPDDPSSVERFWPADVHVIGKEINRFHTVLWPAMLMAAGFEPPKHVAVHGWITVEGQKMSKSLGNVIEPEALLRAYGLDATRYLLLRYVPFTNDGDYSRERYVERYAADLANDLGNLLYRVTSMAQKYRAGRVPEKTGGDLAATWAAYKAHMSSFRFDLALEETWKIIREANQFIDRTKPWTLAKEGNDAELDRALYRLLETLRHVAWMVRPIMPRTSDRVLDSLGVAEGREDKTFDDVSSWGGLEPGTHIPASEPLFPRLET